MINLPFFNKPAKTSDRFLCISIDSDFVRCLAMYKENKNMKIIGVGKSELDPGKVRSGSIVYPDQVATVLEDATNIACTELGEGIDETIVGISGDLCVGLMTTIKAKRPGAAVLTRREIEDFNDKIKETAYIQVQNEFMQINGNSENDLETITSSNVYMKIDNQRVSSLEGHTGSVVEFATFNAFVPSFHVKAIQQTTREAGLNVIAMGSSMYCLVQNTIEANASLSDFILVEVGGDCTNASVVFGKGIVATRTLNVGYRHFIEGVSEKMGLTLKESDRVVKSYIQGKLTQSETTVVQNALRTALEIWVSGLELLFAEYSGVKTFAPKILFTGEGTDLPDLWNVLHRQEWTKSIPFKAPPELGKLTFLDLGHLTDATGKASGSEWLPTACLSMIKSEMEAEND